MTTSQIIPDINPAAEVAAAERMLTAALDQHAQGKGRDDRMLAIDWIEYAARKIIAGRRELGKQVQR